jgi:hypothetical protein
MNTKYIVYISAALAVASLGYYFYEKKKNDEFNRRIDTVESALEKLNNM